MHEFALWLVVAGTFGGILGAFLTSKRRAARCWHHDRHTGTSWVDGRLIDLGRRKMFRCSKCDRTEIV